MATNLTRLRPATLHIEGHAVRVNCKRLTLEEAEEHRVFVRELLQRTPEQEAKPLPSDMAERLRHAIESYLSVPPGELSIDEQPVTTGAQLLDLIGESPRALLRALLVISGASTVSADEGKPSASEPDLVPSSDVQAPAPAGPRQATTASGAETAATAPNEDAMAETEKPLSGPTAILN